MEQLLYKGEQQRIESFRYLNYWIKVVRYHSPGATLLMVGTRLDKVKQKSKNFEKDMNNISLILKKLIFTDAPAVAEVANHKNIHESIHVANAFLEDIAEDSSNVGKRLNMLHNDKNNRLFFPVDLISGNGIRDIRLKLDSEAPKQHYFKNPIPVLWLKFLDKMQDSGKKWLDGEMVKACAVESMDGKVQDIDGEMVEALKMLHELGYIMYITNIKVMAGYVVTDPEWLRNVSSKLMFTKQLHDFDLAHVKETGLSNDLDEALKTGIITKGFLSYLWGEEDLPFVLRFLEQSLLMSRWKFGEESEPKYIVPSLIPHGSHPDQDLDYGMDLKCAFSFKRFLTLGVYERLVCQVVQSTLALKGKSKPPLIVGEYSRHWFADEFEFTLERLPDMILMRIVAAKKDPIKCVSRLLKMFDKIHHFLGVGFMVIPKLRVDDVYVPYEEVKETKNPVWFKSS